MLRDSRRKKVVCDLLLCKEAHGFLYSKFLEFPDLDLIISRDRLLQVRNLVDGRDKDEYEFTKVSDYSLWESASGHQRVLIIY